MIERAVRRESRNATDLRIVLLEDEHFVTVHSRKVKPLVPGRMLDKVNFSRARRVAHFAGHKIGRAQCAAITDSKRRIKDGSADRTPDIDDAVTIDRCGTYQGPSAPDGAVRGRTLRNSRCEFDRRQPACCHYHAGRM